MAPHRGSTHGCRRFGGCLCCPQNNVEFFCKTACTLDSFKLSSCSFRRSDVVALYLIVYDHAANNHWQQMNNEEKIYADASQVLACYEPAYRITMHFLKAIQ